MRTVRAEDVLGRAPNIIINAKLKCQACYGYSPAKALDSTNEARRCPVCRITRLIWLISSKFAAGREKLYVLRKYNGKGERLFVSIRNNTTHQFSHKMSMSRLQLNDDKTEIPLKALLLEWIFLLHYVCVRVTSHFPTQLITFVSFLRASLHWRNRWTISVNWLTWRSGRSVQSNIEATFFWSYQKSRCLFALTRLCSH